MLFECIHTDEVSSCQISAHRQSIADRCLFIAGDVHRALVAIAWNGSHRMVKHDFWVHQIHTEVVHMTTWSQIPQIWVCLVPTNEAMNICTIPQMLWKHVISQSHCSLCNTLYSYTLSCWTPAMCTFEIDAKHMQEKCLRKYTTCLDSGLNFGCRLLSVSDQDPKVTKTGLQQIIQYLQNVGDKEQLYGGVSSLWGHYLTAWEAQRTSMLHINLVGCLL